MAKEKGDTKHPQPAQHQSEQPGREWKMHPEPVTIRDSYRGSGKLDGKVALITGGDSGIGRAVAVHFAREGADVAIVYLEEDEDAQTTRDLVEREGKRCLIIAADVSHVEQCKEAVAQTVRTLGRLDVLVNNAAQQYPKSDITEISPEQLAKTFETNVFGYFYMIQAALPKLEGHGAIINTGSVTGFRGNDELVDYSATKGAIRALTYSLAKKLLEKGVRVNGVAPGPVWTPLIPASFSAEEVAEFGADNPMKRPAQPCEIAPAYVYLACEDSSFVAGQFIHVNGGGYMN